MSADLIKIDRIECIPEEYKNTPIGELLAYHNLGKTYQQYQQAQLLIGMCMDNRKHLSIPDNFAYIIRSGGANLRYSEFRVSYACLLYTSPSPRDRTRSRMPSSA